MKKIAGILVLGILCAVSGVWAGDDPDLEGRVTKLETGKSVITVKNELDNKIGLREYRVLVKQGMINHYKMGHRLKIWLMADRKEARHIERVD
jgi:hypothetical protein